MRRNGCKRRSIMENAIKVITPYWYSGTWVFDDPAVDLIREPFVSGVPEMINVLVEEIRDARDDFRLTFSHLPFPGHQRKLDWLREEAGGHWYCSDQDDMEGWLCPALFKYYDDAPPELYVRADPVS
jgi:hypothetical protein